MHVAGSTTGNGRNANRSRSNRSRTLSPPTRLSRYDSANASRPRFRSTSELNSGTGRKKRSSIKPCNPSTPPFSLPFAGAANCICKARPPHTAAKSSFMLRSRPRKMRLTAVEALSNRPSRATPPKRTHADTSPSKSAGRSSER